jgi:hypothetical protein
MERAVERVRGARGRARLLTRAASLECERKFVRSESVKAPVEMRLQKLSGLRRFGGGNGIQRRGHAPCAEGRDVSMSVEGGKGQGNRNDECPNATGPPTHEPRLPQKPARRRQNTSGTSAHVSRR